MSNATPDFSSILSRQSSDVERPKPLPIGQYAWGVKGLPRFDKSAKKNTPFVEFTVMPIQLVTGDEEELDAVLTRKDGTKKTLQDQTQRVTFYLTEDALWRLKKFLTQDLKLDEGDATLEQLIEQTPGSQFLGELSHTPTDDGTGVYANIKSTAPLD